MSSTTQRSLATAALVAGLLAAAPAAHGAWSEPQALGGDVLGDLAVAPDGSASAATLHFARPGAGIALALLDAPPGAPFGSPVEALAASDADRLRDAKVDEVGAVVALAQRSRAPYPRVRASVVAPDGTAGPWRTISRRGHTARAPSLAVAPSGEAVATWLGYDGERWHVDAAVRAPGAERFGPAQRLGGPVGRLTLPEAAIGEGGDAVVHWRGNAEPEPLRVALRRPGEPFGPARVLADAAGAVHAVVAPDGAMALAVTVPDGTIPPPEGDPDPSLASALRVATVGAGGGRFALGPRLDRGEANAQSFQNLEVDVAGGRLAVLWGQSEEVPGGSRRELRNALRVFEGPLGGELQRTAEVAVTRRQLLSSGLALGDDGAAAVAFGDPRPNRPGDPTARDRFSVALRAAGATAFAAPEAIGPEVQSSRAADLELLPDGGVLAAWDAFDTDTLGERGRSVLVARFTS